MPTIFSHPAVPLGIAPWLRRAPGSLIAVAAITSSLPDADVAAFGFGIPYDHPLGHRGFTHSIAFAVVFTALAAFAYTVLISELCWVWLPFAVVGILGALNRRAR